MTSACERATAGSLGLVIPVLSEAVREPVYSMTVRIRATVFAATLVSALLAPESHLRAQSAPTTLREVWRTTDFGHIPFSNPTFALITPWDEVWVTDSGLRSVFRWSLQGVELGRIGRRGEGPGEFESPWLMTLVGDTAVAVHDQRLQRLSFFDSEGQLLESWNLPVSSTTHGWVGALAVSGDTVLVGTESLPDPVSGKREAQVWQFVNGRVEATLVRRLPGRTVAIGQVGAFRPSIEHQFSGEPHFVAARGLPGKLVFANSDDAQLRILNLAGVTEQHIDLPMPPRSVPARLRQQKADSLQARLEQQLSEVPIGPTDRSELRAEYLRLQDVALAGRTAPLFADAALGHHEVLLKDYFEPTLWWRVGPSTGGRIRFPENFRRLDGGDETMIVGIALDSLGVATVIAMERHR